MKQLDFFPELTPKPSPQRREKARRPKGKPVRVGMFVMYPDDPNWRPHANDPGPTVWGGKPQDSFPLDVIY